MFARLFDSVPAGTDDKFPAYATRPAVLIFIIACAACSLSASLRAGG
jgi:hypothetical protein